METAAGKLAARLSAQQKPLCQQVATRLLSTFPELEDSLRLEENYSPTDRLAQVAVERLNELVRSVLLFDLPSLADNEITWAHGVLPRRGVTYQHQSTMIRLYFEEVRRLPLTPSELEVLRTMERHFLQAVTQAYQAD